MDGVSFLQECSSEHLMPNVYCSYSGYYGDMIVNNVFANDPDGKVFCCAMNYPGSWANGMLTVCFCHTSSKGLGVIKSV